MEFALRTINNDRVRRSPETLALVGSPMAVVSRLILVL